MNRDKTGPNGEGPKTGRGLGDCDEKDVITSEDEKPTTMRGGRGPANGRGFFGRGSGIMKGRGFNRGIGKGQGFGRGRGRNS